MTEYPPPVVSDFNDIVCRLQEELSSPVAHLLSASTIDEATESEQNQIRDVISSAAETIETIDMKLHQAKLLFEFLYSKKEDYENFVGQHKALIAPVNLLPPEILSKIFMDVRKLELRRATVIKPTITSRISRRWRYIALQTPQLWSTIGIRIYDSDVPEYSAFVEHQLQATADWLERSTVYPLTLHITSSSDYCRDIVNILIAHTDRWKTLIIEGPLLVDLLTALQDQNKALPMLESCKFGRSNLWFPPILPGKRWRFLLKAEKLRHITVLDPVDPSLLEFPLNTITFLDTSANAFRLYNIFHQAKSLQTLFLEFHEWVRLGTPLTSPQNLISLHLDCITGRTYLQRLPLFPSLRRLFLFFGPSNPIPDPEVDFLPLFKDSGSNLEHLTLSVALPPEILAKCFEYTPKVKVLHIHGTLSPEIIQQLTLEPNYEGLVPHLHTLNLSGKIKFSLFDLKSMLTSRAGLFGEEMPEEKGSPSLRLVHLLPDRQHAAAREDFAQLIGAVNGVNIRIRGHDWETFSNHQYADANGEYESRQEPWLLG